METKRKRRVNPLTREKARARMLALPVEERKARARKMVEARAAKRRSRPERLEVVETRMDALGERIATAPADERWSLRTELRALGNERLDLKYDA